MFIKGSQFLHRFQYTTFEYMNLIPVFVLFSNNFTICTIGFSGVSLFNELDTVIVESFNTVIASTLFYAKILLNCHEYVCAKKQRWTLKSYKLKN